MRLSILFVTLLIVGSVAGIVAPAQLNGVGSVRAADIREINLDGLKKILQRDPKDTRPLLINFWATWCDPCREEFPDLVKIDADYAAARLNFVAVSLDDVTDFKIAVPKFLKEMKATMSVVLLNVNDPEPAIKVVDAAWDGQLPATFLYDKDGHRSLHLFEKLRYCYLDV